ncbi:MAG: FHA domain-containing serine/threonine-protein kinase [Planctomycetota bacterium]
MAKLVVESGVDKGREYSLKSSATLIGGRESGVEMRISDSLASRQHFKIENRNDEFILTDLQSTNGTYLNGKSVTQARLRIGDRIRVGEILISLLPDEEKDDAGGLIGEVLAGYRLERRIGRGGMGTVYLAMQLSLKRPVALKILSDDLAQNSNFISMFISEARAAAQLQHPNIVLAYDVGKDRDRYYFAMEYVSGGSIQNLVARRKRLTVSEAIHYTVEAGKGLEYAERKGIVHRDIKPDNLMITDDDSIKICDLGLARSYLETDDEKRAEGIAGSPHYIAPEQALGKQVDHRADIYSLGATMYRMLAGTTPFSGGSIKELLKKHVRETPRKLSELNRNVPQVLSHVVEKMMAKTPEQRYQSARDVIEDIKAIEGLDFGLELADEEPDYEGAETRPSSSTHLSGTATTPPPPPPLPPAVEVGKGAAGKARARHLHRRIALTIVVLVILAAAGVGLWKAFGPGEQKNGGGDDRPPNQKELSDKVARLRRAVENFPEKADQNIFQSAVRNLFQMKKQHPESTEVSEALKFAGEHLLKYAESKMPDYKAAVDILEWAKDLLRDDSAFLSVADGRIAELEQDAVGDALEELEDLLEVAQLFEDASDDLNNVHEIYKAFKEVETKRREKYGWLESPEFDKVIQEAGKKIKEYGILVDEMVGQEKYDGLKEDISRALNLNLPEYAVARTTLAKLREEFPNMTSRDRGLAAVDSKIENAARKEFRKLIAEVNRTIEKTRFNPDTKSYDGLPQAVETLESVLSRYGDGKLNEREDAGKLVSETKTVIATRSRIESLLELNSRDEAVSIAEALPGKVLNRFLKVLAGQCATEVKHRAARMEILEKFNKLKVEVAGLVDGFEFEEAKKKVGGFTDDDKEIRDELNSLKKEVNALVSAHKKMIEMLNAEINKGKRIVIDKSGRPVRSVSIDGVLVEEMASPKPWGKLDSYALGMLYTEAGRPSGGDERFGLALICLQKGAELRMFSLGIDLMSELADGGGDYATRFAAYRAEMGLKVQDVLNRLLKEYELVQDDPDRRKELKQEITDLNTFKEEHFETAPEDDSHE